MLAWALILVAGGIASGKLAPLLSNTFSVPGTSSEHVKLVLQEHFGDRADGAFTVVYQLANPTTPATIARLQAVNARAAATIPTGSAGPLAPAGNRLVYGSIVSTLKLADAKAYTAPLLRTLGTPPGVAHTYVTGAAAIHGLLGRPGTAIFILYPDGRVSPLQERQMACTGADNVYALAVEGTFDDAQAALKEVFGDQAFRTAHRLSAVNSINLARVLAQCVYYLYAWLRLPAAERADVEFVVPTGNFGNVLAGWLLQQMGVPIGGFRIATNQNDILYRLFTTGEYRVADVKPSLAPSMDIQVASNFERFLYYRVGRDPARVRAVMEQFRATGACRFSDWDHAGFTASRCDDAEIPGIIRRVHRDYGYVTDPHTACAFKDLTPGRSRVVLATASPAKFPETIRAAIGIEPTHPALEALKSRPVVKHRLRAAKGPIQDFIAAHAV